MKRGEPSKIITGFYDEYQKKKAKKQASQITSTEPKEQKEIVRIQQPVTVRAYGRIRLFFASLLGILKYLVISILLSAILTILLNGEIRTLIIELFQTIF